MPPWVGSFALLAVLVLAWQVLAWTGGAALASPAATLQQLAALLGNSVFWIDIGATARAFALAVLLSTAGGLILAAVLGRSRLATAVAEPLLMQLYAVPKVTLYPLVLLVFGLGTEAKVAFGVMHGVFPLMLFTLNAMANVPPAWLRTAAILRLSAAQTVVTILLPAILPEILAGLRLAVSLSLLGVLIGEMFASSRGLGHRAMTAMNNGDTATVLAIALLLMVFAVSLNLGMLRLSRWWPEGKLVSVGEIY